MSRLTIVLFAAIACYVSAMPSLQIFEAGKGGKEGPTLEDGMKFCPSTFSNRGFSVECKLPSSAKSATIAVNGGEKMEEMYTPFFAAGNNGEYVFPLKVDAGSLEIMCEGGGYEITKEIEITCEASEMKANMEASMEASMDPMMSAEPKMSVDPVMSSEPKMSVDPVMSSEPKMSVDPKMSPEAKMSVDPVMSPEAKMSVDPVMSPEAKMSVDPVMMMEGKNMDEKKMMEPTVTPTATSTPMPRDMMKKSDSKCDITEGDCEKMGGMRRLGADVEGEKGSDWTDEGMCALTWKKGDKFEGIVKSDVSQLVYEFTPTVTSNFGVVIDMGTKHPTEHNDVWLKCDGGLDRRQGDKTKSRVDGFAKIYHNQNGRAMLSLTVDFDPYSVSTPVWKAGKTYTCVIAARSTRVTVYGISLFPCKGSSCEKESAQWKEGVKKCNFM